MVGRDTLDDRQSQPGAPGGPAQCLINAEESFEYALLVFGFDAPTLVGHDDFHEIVRRSCADRHWATGWRVGHCIVDQVGQGGHQQRRITDEEQSSR